MERGQAQRKPQDSVETKTVVEVTSERGKDCPPVKGVEREGGGEEAVMARRWRREQGMMGKLVGEMGELELQYLLWVSLQNNSKQVLNNALF